jgi:hypothetical protein
MTLREKMLSVYRGRGEGEIPWAAYGGLLPSGIVERELRNRGCGLIHWAPVYSWLPPGMGHMKGWDYESEIKNVELSVKTVWEDNERIFVRVYDTPLGSVFEKLREDPAYHSLWTKEFLIKSPRDYEIIKFMVENTVFREQYDSYLEAQENMGEDGVVMAVGDRSPWQKMLIELAGTERLYFDLHDNPALVEDLYSLIEEKQDEVYDIVADSQAELVWVPDNLTGDLTPPRIFETYCLPFYNKQAKRLHEKNKIVVVHMDGRLRSLKDLIKKADIDVIESFTFPEAGGDLPIEEASVAWEDKAIMANLPASVCFQQEEEVRDYMGKLLGRISPRKNFMLLISENLPAPSWRTTLQVVADVMQNQ